MDLTRYAAYTTIIGLVCVVAWAVFEYGWTGGLFVAGVALTIIGGIGLTSG